MPLFFYFMSEYSLNPSCVLCQNYVIVYDWIQWKNIKTSLKWHILFLESALYFVSSSILS